MKIVLIILAIIIVGVGVWFYSLSNWLSVIPSPHSLEYTKETFDPLASAILQQNDILSMDDCTRHTKKINNVRVRMNYNQDSSDIFGAIRYYQDALDSMKINRKLFEELREQLESTKLREFHRSGDSILFVVDGFLDHSWGFLYCAQNGPIDTNYIKINLEYARVVEEVNPHWKKVSIN